MNTLKLTMTFAEINEDVLNPIPRRMDLEDMEVQTHCLELELFGILSDSQVEPPFIDPSWDFSRIIKAADEVRQVISDSYEVTDVFFNEDGHLQVEYTREV